MSVQESASTDDRPAQIEHWFTKRGFQAAIFAEGKLRVTTYRMGEHIIFRLKERPGYVTYYKETGEGALIVFEVRVEGDRISYEGYCPLLLFGIWPMKLAFKQGARVPFKYRDEGYRIAQEFAQRVASGIIL